MRCRQRHGDGHIALVIDLDAVDQAQIVDIDRDFRVEDFLERSDHRFVEITARRACGHVFGLFLQEAFEIVALALHRRARRFFRIDSVLDTGAWRLGSQRIRRGGRGNEITVLIVVHPKIL